MSGTLYVVATPIGNLADVSLRALETLRGTDYILAEDTRVTLKLLRHFGIERPLLSYSEHSSPQKEERILSELAAGRCYALVSDAGTPAVSDPGARLVALAAAQEIPVVPIPGASAVSALVSVFGEPATAYHFWGFFPHKKIRQRELIAGFRTIAGIHVFFESPFRIAKTLRGCFLPHDDFHLVIGREMTKSFETFYRGTPAQVLELMLTQPVKGEFVVGVTTRSPASTETEDA